MGIGTDEVAVADRVAGAVDPGGLRVPDSDDAVDAGIAALRAGAPAVVDVDSDSRES